MGALTGRVGARAFPRVSLGRICADPAPLLAMQEGFPEQLSTPLAGVDGADTDGESGAEPGPPATNVVMVVDVGAPPMPVLATQHGASAAPTTVAVVAAQGPVPALPTTGSATELQVGVAALLVALGVVATLASRWATARRGAQPIRPVG